MGSRPPHGPPSLRTGRGTGRETKGALSSGRLVSWSHTAILTVQTLKLSLHGEQGKTSTTTRVVKRKWIARRGGARLYLKHSRRRSRQICEF